jgi:predicted outer membrane repeat protein
MRASLVFALLFLASCLSATATPNVVYVDCNAPGPEHDGTSWDTAFLTIQQGVDAATPDGDVWVADGTYVENVVMGSGVAIYGGFLGAEPGGYETSLDQRDYTSNIATIDGNQSGSCVVMAVDARVDGFAITNGIGVQIDHEWHGGGVYCSEMGETGEIANNTLAANSVTSTGGGIHCFESSPMILDNRITGNSARGGGGIYCDTASPMIFGNSVCANSAEGHSCAGGGIYASRDSSPTISSNLVEANVSEDYGGGVCCAYGSRALITANAVIGNTGDSGGGICVYAASPTITENVIIGNTGTGAGICIMSEATASVLSNTIADNTSSGRGGGFFCFLDSSATAVNNTVVNNSARYGGGLCVYWDAELTGTNNTIVRNSASEEGGGVWFDGTSLSLTNCIVAQNAADIRGGGIYCSDPPPSLSHNDFWENSPTDYDGCEPGEADISADPMFADPEAGDFHLLLASPCIDSGLNGAPALPRTDFEGDLRILDGDSDELPVVDIGADEFSPEGHVVTIIDLPTGDVALDEDAPLEFAGTAYHTGDLVLVDYLWEFGEGSGIPDAHAEDPGFVTFREPGVYIVGFDAQAENGSWCLDPDTRTITVLTVAPEALIDSPASDVTIYKGDCLDFAGTATDANGQIVDWLWTFGEGSGIPDIHVEDPGEVQFNNAGVFAVVFNAQDEDGNWDPDPETRTIHVRGWPVVYVDADSPGPEHDGLSWDTAFLTIQDGLHSATPDGDVWVADGTYVENLVMGSGVAIYGGFLGAEPGGYETALGQRDFESNATTIDGNQSGDCVVMALDTRADGFLITNGKRGILCDDGGGLCVIANNTVTANQGRGISCDHSSPTIVQNRITGNQGGGVSCINSDPAIAHNTITENSTSVGGGISCYESSPSVDTNLMAGNSAEKGGAIYCYHYCSPQISGNIISGNRSQDSGGAIYLDAFSPAAIEGNTITGNSCESDGGGLYSHNSSPIVSNNTIIRNASQSGGGIWCHNSAPVLSHNDFWNNTPDNYRDCEPGEGDISADPMFVDPENGDFHLTSESPCIDSGSNDYVMTDEDIDGDPRIIWAMRFPVPYWPHPGYVDMGADEFVPGLRLRRELPRP